MNVTINLTPTTNEQFDRIMSFLEASKPLTAVAVLPQAENGSNEPLNANKAYLQSLGRQRTPECTGFEVDLRSKFPAVNWQDLEARHKALLVVGYDIFDPQRNNTWGKAATSPNGATTENLEIDLNNPVE